MKKSHLVRLALLLLTISTLSGCLWVPVDERNRGGYYHERDRGEHRGDRYEDRDDRR